MIERKIIALSGLSGAGKSTVLKELKLAVEFVHLSAGELIKEQKLIEENENASAEQLRNGDIQHNQRLFKAAFRRRTSKAESTIILDCHTLIDTPGGMQLVPEDTFDHLGLTNFCFLRINPPELVRRRMIDVRRERPIRSEHDLAEQQLKAFDHAGRIARALAIPFLEIDYRSARKKLVLLINENEG